MFYNYFANKDDQVSAFIWPCKFMMVHYGVCGATGVH